MRAAASFYVLQIYAMSCGSRHSILTSFRKPGSPAQHLYLLAGLLRAAIHLAQRRVRPFEVAFAEAAERAAAGCTRAAHDGAGPRAHLHDERAEKIVGNMAQLVLQM